MIVGFLAVMLAAPAFSDEETVDKKQVRLVTDSYVRCLVDRQGKKVRSALRIPVGSPLMTWEAVQAFIRADCLNKAYPDKGASKMLFKPRVIRGPIFEKLYANDFAKQPATSFAGVPPVAYPADPASDEGRSYGFAMAIGDCVVRAAPEKARVLLAAKVESDDEAATMQSITNDISACIPQDQSIKFNSTAVRGMLAEPLYRLTEAKAGPAHA